MRRAWMAVALALMLGSCSSNLPSVNVVAVADEAALGGEAIPPADAVLFPATWDQAATWAARESARGRPVVINLFASWCGPCKAEAPLLRRAIDNHPDVAFLLVDHVDGIEAGRTFLQEVGLIDVPSVFDDAGVIARAIKGRAMPTTAFFSASGDLVELIHGVLTEPVLAQLLADLEATIPAT